MHIILICQAYPPHAAVGAIRSGNVAQAFLSRGHNVTVITAAMDNEVPGVRTRTGRLEVRTVRIGLKYRERVTALTRRLRPRRKKSMVEADPRAPVPSAQYGAAPVSANRAGFFKRLALALLWLPDDEQRFVRPAYREARRVARDNAELIYTSAPSFSTHVVGLLLRRRTGIRWIAEFRDPWISDPGGSFRRNEYMSGVSRLNRALELRCLRAADVVVTVTERTRQLYQQRLGIQSREKVVTIRNGIEKLDMSRPEAKSGPFRIVYSGSIYGDRDPRGFLSALNMVVRQRGLTCADVQVDLYVGRTRFVGTESLEQFVITTGMAEMVRFLDWLPRAQLLRALREADLLLLLAMERPLQVPTKLYEYLGVRVPILAFVDDDGESAAMLRQVGGHYVLVSNDMHLARTALNEALDRRGIPVVGSEGVLEEWLTSRQMEQLMIVLGA